MYLDALKNATNGAKAAAPNPATQGLGPVPPMPNLPPPPTGMGPMPTGAPTTTKMTAGADAIAGLRSLQGFVPKLFNEINAWIDQIKGATSDKPGENPGPGIGEPGVPGAAQLDSSATMQSGSPGAF